MTTIAILVLLAVHSSGETWQQLKPCRPAGQMSPYRLEMRGRIQSTLGLGSPYSFHRDRSTLEARALVLPSFEPERALSVLVAHDGSARVTSVIPVESISGANVIREEVLLNSDESVAGTTAVFFRLVEPAADVEVQERTAPIDPELAKRIGDLFEEAIFAAGHQRGQSVNLVLDGVVHELSTFVIGHGLICAEAHSPDDESTGGRLVRLIEALERLATGDAADRADTLETIVSILDEGL